LDRGGTFIYDSSKVAEHNDGTNFNGWIRQYSGAVNVKWFGAVGDGVADDTQIIQIVLDYANTNNNIVFIPNGTYMINSTKNGTYYGLMMHDNTYLILSPNAILKAIPNDSTNYSIIQINNKTNVTIEGGTIEGERNNHNGTDGEWGMGIYVVGSNKIIIKDMTIKNCWGDGIYLSIDANNNYSSNIFINNVISDNNRRQGMSIVSAYNVLVKHSWFTNTNGTAPSAGVDLEPDISDYPNKEITFIDCHFINNDGYAVVAGNYNDNHNINFDQCKFVAGYNGLAVWFVTPEEQVSRFTNCTIKGPCVHFKNVIFDNCFFYHDTNWTKTVYTIAIDDDSFVKFNNCKIYAKGTRPLYIEGSATKSTAKVFNGCKIITDGDGAGNKTAVIILRNEFYLSNCIFDHVGTEPADGFIVAVEGFSKKAENTWFSPVYRYYNNIQGVSENYGIASVKDGDTIPHGLFRTPSIVNITTTVENHIASVTSDSTNLTIHLTDNSGNAITTAENIYWFAKV